MDTNIGSSLYRVDIGVLDPADPKRYIAGILCDGENYHRTTTTKDREVTRPGVLKGLGWRLLRAWSVDWFSKPDKTLTTLTDTLQTMHHTVTSPPSAPTVATATGTKGFKELLVTSQKVDTTHSAGKPYQVTPLKPVDYPISDFDYPRHYDLVSSQIMEVINTEAPIHSDLLARRVLEAWGCSRLTSRLSGHISVLCTNLQLPTTTQAGHTFYWQKDQDPSQVSTYRTPYSDVYDIPPEEMIAAMTDILRSQLSLPKEDLKREAALLFGFTRMGRRVKDATDATLDAALRKGLFTQKEDRIMLP